MRLRSILNIFREIRYLKSIVKKYNDRLLPGRYLLFPGFRALALNTPDTIKFAHNYFDKPGINPRMASIAKMLNRFKYFTNRNKKSSGKYEALYTANNYDKLREIKLFSFKNSKILTICTSHSDLEKQLKQYALLSDSYPMPNLKVYHDYPNSFEVSMIKVQRAPTETGFAKSITASTMLFNKNAELLTKKLASELIEFSYDDQTNALLSSIVSLINPEILDTSFPLCLQHGDLSKDNLIYGEIGGRSEFWWIDWEHSSERVFFYDLFFYMINSALYYDTKAFDCYMRGELDPYIIPFFNHFGITFFEKSRKDYFLVFAIVFLKERVCKFNRISALKTYCTFLMENCI